MSDRPAHIAALDAALEDARERIDSKASELGRFREENAAILQREIDIRGELTQAERDRVNAEDAIRMLGYIVPPRRKAMAS